MVCFNSRPAVPLALAASAEMTKACEGASPCSATATLGLRWAGRLRNPSGNPGKKSRENPGETLVVSLEVISAARFNRPLVFAPGSEPKAGTRARKDKGRYPGAPGNSGETTGQTTGETTGETTGKGMGVDMAKDIGDAGWGSSGGFASGSVRRTTLRCLREPPT